MHLPQSAPYQSKCRQSGHPAARQSRTARRFWWVFFPFYFVATQAEAVSKLKTDTVVTRLFHAPSSPLLLGVVSVGREIGIPFHPREPTCCLVHCDWGFPLAAFAHPFSTRVLLTPLSYINRPCSNKVRSRRGSCRVGLVWGSGFTSPWTRPVEA